MSTIVNDSSTPNRWFYMSAYATAVKHGYKGTEAEWLDDVYGGALRADADAEIARQKASDSEAYGAGTRDGEAVEEGDPAYHNNAKYYFDNLDPRTAEMVSEWLEANIDPDTGYVIDGSLSSQYAAADAKAAGDGLFLDKNHSYNTPSGMTTFRATTAGYSSSNKMKPANLPKNSYCYINGGTLDSSEWPSDMGYTSSDLYWIFRYSNVPTVSATGNISMYVIRKRDTRFGWVGWTTDGGSSVTWSKYDYSALDSTLSVSGAAADAKETGDWLFHNKDHSVNTPSGLTTFRQTTAGYSSDNKMKPSDLPKNSYCYINGNTLDSDAFPEGLTYSSEYLYWVCRLANTPTASATGDASMYVIKMHGSTKNWVGFTNDGGATMTWADASFFPLDSGIGTAGKAANSKAVGDFMYHGKNSSYNTPSGITTFRQTTAGYSSDNKMKPADLPKNSYCYVNGGTLDSTKWPSGLTYTSDNLYWVCRLSNTPTVSATGNASWYTVQKHGSSKTWIGFSADGGSTVTWFDNTPVINNTYSNTYNQTVSQDTYNVTATPVITTDTHNYLAPSGDTTDRTTDIETLLATGSCHLGPGDYYVTGITMPVNAELVGSGWKTRIIVANSVTSGAGITLRTNSIVRDLRVCRASEAVLPETIGNVHGIMFASTRTPEDQTPSTPLHATITNVFIHGFVGGGITCTGTGYGYDASLNVSNVCIYNCFAGINVAYFSEFHRFVNCNVWLCEYGAIINGGNVNVCNCSFSGNNTNMLFDNEFGQSPNNSHGNIVGCKIAHSNYNQNDGKAIVLKGAGNGEIFTNCGIAYGAIEIDDSRGIAFVGCRFGRDVSFDIQDSKGVIVNNCTFLEESTVTQSGNTGLKFANDITFAGADYDPLA